LIDLTNPEAGGVTQETYSKLIFVVFVLSQVGLLLKLKWFREYGNGISAAYEYQRNDLHESL
jgi:hypothetical protein